MTPTATIRHGLLCVPFQTQDIEVDRDRRIVRHVISSGTRSHTGLEIDQAGWDFQHYHGIVLWDHDSSAPAIGKNVDMGLRGSPAMLHAATQFAPTDFGQELFTLYAEGYMRDWSVGAFIDESEPIKDADDRVVALRSKRQRLMEYSAVPIGANPDAVTQALGKGLIRPETAAKFGVVPAPASAPAQPATPPEAVPDSLAAAVSRLDESITRLVVAPLARAMER